jgi:hypothetical protein
MFNIIKWFINKIKYWNYDSKNYYTLEDYLRCNICDSNNIRCPKCYFLIDLKWEQR